MKKIMAALAFVLLAAAIGIGAGYYFSHNNTNQTDTALITEQAAQDIAIEDAGLDRAQVDIISVHLDRDDGRQQYDVKFRDTTTKTLYDYELDATNGNILSVEREGNGTATTNTVPQATNEITADDAKAIALKHAGVNEADTTQLHTEYDRDHTGNSWSVDFVVGNTEYDYDISAADGNILHASNEPCD